MPRQLRCADVTGDCDVVVTGDDDQQITDEAVLHAKEVHGFAENEDLRNLLAGAIQDV